MDKDFVSRLQAERETLLRKRSELSAHLESLGRRIDAIAVLLDDEPANREVNPKAPLPRIIRVRGTAASGSLADLVRVVVGQFDDEFTARDIFEKVRAVRSDVESTGQLGAIVKRLASDRERLIEVVRERQGRRHAIYRVKR